MNTPADDSTHTNSDSLQQTTMTFRADPSWAYQTIPTVSQTSHSNGFGYQVFQTNTTVQPSNQTSTTVPQASQTNTTVLQAHQLNTIVPQAHKIYTTVPQRHQTSTIVPQAHQMSGSAPAYRTSDTVLQVHQMSGLEPADRSSGTLPQTHNTPVSVTMPQAHVYRTAVNSNHHVLSAPSHYSYVPSSQQSESNWGSSNGLVPQNGAPSAVQVLPTADPGYKFWLPPVSVSHPSWGFNGTGANSSQSYPWHPYNQLFGKTLKIFRSVRLLRSPPSPSLSLLGKKERKKTQGTKNRGEQKRKGNGN